MEKLETVVIGAGPGGYTAAIRAAQLGKNVTIIEKEHLGGVCLNVGCIPTKAFVHLSETYHEATSKGRKIGVKADKVSLDWEEFMSWKDSVVNQMTSGVEYLLEKNNVQIISGKAIFTGNKQLSVEKDGEIEDYKFDEAIIAVGGQIDDEDGFTYSNRVLNTTGALSSKELPQSIVITGGGYLGSQFAAIYGRLGSKVTVLEASDKLINFFEDDMNKMISDKFATFDDVTLLTNAKALSAEEKDSNVVVTYKENGEEKSIEADYVLVDAHRSPNTDNLGLENTDIEVNGKGKVVVDDHLRTNLEGVYAIGDASSRGGSASMAYHQAKVAAADMNEKKVNVHNVVYPSTMITSMEVGMAGMTEEQAKKAGYDVESTTFNYAGNGRAVAMQEPEGFIRLVYETKYTEILGAQVVGARATDTIHELAYAITNEATLESLSQTVHAHPTLSEGFWDAADAALGFPVHS